MPALTIHLLNKISRPI